MTKQVTELNNKNFNEFIKEDKVAIDFWAPWCGPCKMMGPIFDEAATDLKDKAKFGKVNVDENQELAQRFQVMSIPTIIFFRDGEQIERHTGVLQKEEIAKKINESK